MQEVEYCPLCGDPEDQFFESVEQGDKSVIYRICPTCSLVYQTPRMTSEDLEAYYSDRYMKEHQASDSVTRKELFVQRGRADEFKKMLSGRVKPGDRHLDIGSSAGVLIDELQQQYGTSGQGVEPGELYRLYCEAKGLTVYPRIEDVPDDSRPFDLITMAHVLEHLSDPVEYLRDLRREYLAPHGLLLIEVPNLYFHPSLEQPHLFAFTPRTLNLILARADFCVVRRRLHGRPRSHLFPFYITVLAQPPARSARDCPPSGSAAKVRAFRWLGTRARRLGERFLPGLAWVPVPVDGDELRSSR